MNYKKKYLKLKSIFLYGGSIECDNSDIGPLVPIDPIKGMENIAGMGVNLFIYNTCFFIYRENNINVLRRLIDSKVLNENNVNIPLGNQNPDFGRRSNGILIWRNSKNSPFLLVLDALLYSNHPDYTILEDLINIKADIYTDIPGTINTPLYHVAKNGNKYQILIFKLLLANVDSSNQIFLKSLLKSLLSDSTIKKLGYIIVLLLEKQISVISKDCGDCGYCEDCEDCEDNKLFEKISDVIFDNLQETGLKIYDKREKGERYDYYKVIIDKILTKRDTTNVYDLLGIFINYYKQ